MGGRRRSEKARAASKLPQGLPESRFSRTHQARPYHETGSRVLTEWDLRQERVCSRGTVQMTTSRKSGSPDRRSARSRRTRNSSSVQNTRRQWRAATRSSPSDTRLSRGPTLPHPRAEKARPWRRSISGSPDRPFRDLPQELKRSRSLSSLLRKRALGINFGKPEKWNGYGDSSFIRFSFFISMSANCVGTRIKI